MLDKEQIMRIIPHRPPMLFLDEVLELEPGVSVAATMKLTGEEFFFSGHFPGNPVLPGVVMVEAMAQAGAVCVLSMPEYAGKTAYFAGIDGVKFKRKVCPGEILRLELQVVKIRGPVGVGMAAAYVGDQRAAFGELTFAVDI